MSATSPAPRQLAGAGRVGLGGRGKLHVPCMPGRYTRTVYARQVYTDRVWGVHDLCMPGTSVHGPCIHRTCMGRTRDVYGRTQDVYGRTRDVYRSRIFQILTEKSIILDHFGSFWIRPKSYGFPTSPYFPIFPNLPDFSESKNPQILKNPQIFNLPESSRIRHDFSDTDRTVQHFGLF